MSPHKPTIHNSGPYPSTSNFIPHHNSIQDHPHIPTPCPTHPSLPEPPPASPSLLRIQGQKNREFQSIRRLWSSILNLLTSFMMGGKRDPYQFVECCKGRQVGMVWMEYQGLSRLVGQLAEAGEQNGDQFFFRHKSEQHRTLQVIRCFNKMGRCLNMNITGAQFCCLLLFGGLQCLGK